MEIKEMSIEEVEARTLEIQSEVDSADETRMSGFRQNSTSSKKEKPSLKRSQPKRRRPGRPSLRPRLQSKKSKKSLWRKEQ